MSWATRKRYCGENSDISIHDGGKSFRKRQNEDGKCPVEEDPEDAADVSSFK